MQTWSGKYLPRPLFPPPPHQNGATVSPTHALFIPSHPNMKCLLLFPPSTHVASVLPASFLANGISTPHFVGYWSHSHTGASVEKGARSSDKECSDRFGVLSFWFFVKVAAYCNTKKKNSSLERVMLKRGQSCWSCPEAHKRKAVCKLSCCSTWQEKREVQT